MALLNLLHRIVMFALKCFFLHAVSFVQVHLNKLECHKEVYLVH